MNIIKGYYDKVGKCSIELHYQGTTIEITINCDIILQNFSTFGQADDKAHMLEAVTNHIASLDDDLIPMVNIQGALMRADMNRLKDKVILTDFILLGS